MAVICHYLFLISLFGASGGLCFMFVTISRVYALICLCYLDLQRLKFKRHIYTFMEGNSVKIVFPPF